MSALRFTENSVRAGSATAYWRYRQTVSGLLALGNPMDESRSPRIVRPAQRSESDGHCHQFRKNRIS